jgi:acetyl esterase/lipase
MPAIESRRVATAAGALPCASAGCQQGPSQQATIARADADMRAVLDAQQALGARPIADLSVAAARRQPTPADAARRVLRSSGRDASPRPMPQVSNVTIPGSAGPLQEWLYGPRQAEGPLPMIVYWHGGGWVIADLETYDASARALATETGAIVLSVHYRQGPEDRFPAAQDDAVAANRWAMANARRLGGDPNRIAVAGESAGGNLAANVAIAARGAGLPRPVHQLLVYPVAGTDTTVPSFRENANAMPLNPDTIHWFLQYYTRGSQDLRGPRLDLVGRADLRGLPPTTIVLAEIDPLRSGGEALARRLRESGVLVELRTYQGTRHEFFGLGSTVADARAAQDFAGGRLRAAFASGGRAG